MTVEGAPHMKDEHLQIFDCANVCGRIGKRFCQSVLYHHDGRRTAIHIRRDFQDNQYAEQCNCSGMW